MLSGAKHLCAHRARPFAALRVTDEAIHDAQRQVVLETGATTGFWINVAQAIIFSTQAILAFSQLARLTKRVRAVEGKPRLADSDDKAVG